MDYVKEIQLVMNILAGLCPRVDQYATLTQPIAYCVNKLADVRDNLQKSAEAEKKQQNKLDNLTDEEREGILNHARDTFGKQAQ